MALGKDFAGMPALFRPPYGDGTCVELVGRVCE
jgi:hypothetical protein